MTYNNNIKTKNNIMSNNDTHNIIAVVVCVCKVTFDTVVLQSMLLF